MEKYISFTRYIPVDEENEIVMRFIDSARFLQASLESLVKNLEDGDMKSLKEFFTSEHQFQLLRQKGIFPYEYVNNINCLQETCLPPKSKFCSVLNSKEIDDSDYLRAQKIWVEFNIKNLGEYSDLYLKTDVILLCDVFEKFRDSCIRTYDLDPAQYFTLPGLSWDAMLKKTGVELELLTDIDMFYFVKKNIRGGLCQCVKKYSMANNKYMKNYDDCRESKYLIYLDANNLYGWAMSQYLPQKNFRWLDSDEINNLKVEQIDDCSCKGYILEVDLEYPKNLHDSHNELPFCVENTIPPCADSKCIKLLANLNDKKKYVIHYRNLKQCLKYGLKLKSIHRVLEFEQSQFLKPYIDLNNNLRTQAKHKFDKDMYKLMNNSISGKAMENVDKRIDVRIVGKWVDEGKKLSAENLIKMSNFHSRKIINENLVVIRMNTLKVVYNKPIYIGFSILEISKILMFDFHYDYIKHLYENKAQLLYMDTDSFIYEIKTPDFYEDMKKNLNKFDTSDYSINNIFGLPRINKKVLGKFKDECCGEIILAFYGVKAKTYCFITVNDIIKKIKGIRKNVVENDITAEDFSRCINDSSLQIRKNMFVIRSNKHNVYTEKINKVALESNDDKRFVLPDRNFETIAWGHQAIDGYYFL